MRCYKAKKLLPQMVAGVLDDEKVGLLQNHVVNCDSCGSLLNRLQKVEALLNQPTDVKDDPFFVTRLRARLRENEATTPKQVGKMVWSPLFLAAGLIIGAALGITAGHAVMTRPAAINYAEYYGSADLFRTLPSGSLAATYSQQVVNLSGTGGGRE